MSMLAIHSRTFVRFEVNFAATFKEHSKILIEKSASQNERKKKIKMRRTRFWAFIVLDLQVEKNAKLYNKYNFFEISIRFYNKQSNRFILKYHLTN